MEDTTWHHVCAFSCTVSHFRVVDLEHVDIWVCAKVLDRDIRKYLFKATFCDVWTRLIHEYFGLFFGNTDFCQVPVSLREDTTVSRLSTGDLWNLVLKRTQISCTVSHFCGSDGPVTHPVHLS